MEVEWVLIGFMVVIIMVLADAVKALRARVCDLEIRLGLGSRLLKKTAEITPAWPDPYDLRNRMERAEKR